MDKCYVCLRITPAVIFYFAHKIFDDKEKARKIASESCQIIERTYQINPTYLCGKSIKGVLSGLFYILSYKYQCKKTQSEIAKCLNCKAVTLRKSFKSWYRRFKDEFFQDIENWWE